jgi:hypothetical protein
VNIEFVGSLVGDEISDQARPLSGMLVDLMTGLSCDHLAAYDDDRIARSLEGPATLSVVKLAHNI